MPWIECHTDLFTNPKTLDLQKFMGWSNEQTVAKLVRFWIWCFDYAPDGDLTHVLHRRIALAVAIDEDQVDHFIAGMVYAEFLDSRPYLRIHNWWNYVGRYLQAKHKRQPEVWKRVKALYVKSTTSRPMKKAASPRKKSTARRSPAHKNVTTPPKDASTHKPPLTRNTKTATVVASSTTHCTVPPNLTIPDPSVSDLSKQQQQQQSNRALAQGNIDAVDADLRKLIADHVGSMSKISRNDMSRITSLREHYGKAFFTACRRLHGGVTNAAGYLEAVLRRWDRESTSSLSQGPPGTLNGMLTVICDKCGTAFAANHSTLEREAQAGQILHCPNHKECDRTFDPQLLLTPEGQCAYTVIH